MAYARSCWRSSYTAHPQPNSEILLSSCLTSHRNRIKYGSIVEQTSICIVFQHILHVYLRFVLGYRRIKVPTSNPYRFLEIVFLRYIALLRLDLGS